MIRQSKTKSSTKVDALNVTSIPKKINYDRKCQTPSISKLSQNSKKKSKSKDKNADHQNTSMLKNIKLQTLNANLPLNKHIEKDKMQSPFRHKNRPISNLNNMRHARNIQHQLSNLNESVFKHDSVFKYDSVSKYDEGRKIDNQRFDDRVLVNISQGKKLMKNNNFEKAIKLLKQCLTKDKFNLQALYLIGVCHYHLQQYNDAIVNFVNVLLKHDTFRRNIYLFLAICYKKINHYQQALLTLTKAIILYPNYYDVVFLRSKILVKQKRHYDAIQDLNRCIEIDDQNLQAYVCKADSLRAINQFEDAIQIYSQVIAINFNPEILLKRAISHIQNNSIDSGLSDLNEILTKNVAHSQAYLFKGLAYAKVKNYNDAILSYEQAIKYNMSKKATTKALYEISKLKIEMGDYYGASYNMERSPSLEVDHQVLEKLKVFTEGSTLIMKRKFKKGIENMNNLAKRQHLNEQIKPLIYSFRSYAYFSQCKFSNALNDLNNLLKNGYKLDPASQYNHCILSGIIACQNNLFKEAKSHFTAAETVRTGSVDCLIYICLNYISEYNRNTKKKHEPLLKEALKYIQQAITVQDHSNSHYIQACILYILQDYEESIKSLQFAIQKSDDHVIKHFYLRALLNLKRKKFKEAMNDFNNVLSLTKDLKEKEKQPIDQDEPEREKQIVETYLNRAKCYLLFEEKKKAFKDLQTYISCKPLDSEIHSVAGKLLFSIGACEDAVKAYNFSPHIEKNRQYLLERMKCYLVLKQLNMCLKDMIKLGQLGDQTIKYDQYCLYSLKQASKNQQQHFQQALKKLNNIENVKSKGGHIFKKQDLLFYKGLYLFYLGKYQETIDLWNKSKTIKAMNRDLEYLQGKQINEENLENRIYTGDQIQYNIAIAELMIGRLENSKKVLSKYDGFQILNNEVSADGEQIDLTPFPVNNRLCSIFPEVQYSNNIKFRLSFCLPTIHPPQIEFETQFKIIEDLNMLSTQPRPDAPWIKRNTFGVVFTNEVVGMDVDIISDKSGQPIRIVTEIEDQKPSNTKNKTNIVPLDSELESKLKKIIHKV